MLFYNLQISISSNINKLKIEVYSKSSYSKKITVEISFYSFYSLSKNYKYVNICFNKINYNILLFSLIIFKNTIYDL